MTTMAKAMGITITITISITWRFRKQPSLSNSFTRDEDDLANIFAFLLLQNIQNSIFRGKLLILLSRQNIQNFPWKSKDRHLKFSPLGLLVWETEQILQIPSLIQKKSTKKKLNRKVCKVSAKTNIGNNQQDATSSRPGKNNNRKVKLVSKYKIQN